MGGPPAPTPGIGAGAGKPLGIRCLGAMMYRSIGDVVLEYHLHGPGLGSGRHPKCPAPTLELPDDGTPREKRPVLGHAAGPEPRTGGIWQICPITRLAIETR